MYRNTYVEVNLSNIAHNVKRVVDKYNYKYYIGVVKGNAYGHGYGIIDTLLKNGINFLATSNLDEALEIRKLNKDVGILCLEPIDLKYLDICSKNNISICVSSYDYYKKMSKLDFKLKIHLKIDSGMNRLGFKNSEEVTNLYKDLQNHKNLYLEGVFTHFHTVGIYDKEYDNQMNRFKYLTKDIDLASVDIVHLDRSATMCLHEKEPFENGCRLGIIMYGMEILPEDKKSFRNKLRKIKWDYIRNSKNITYIPYQKLNLKPTFSLVTEVLQINDVKKGEYVGYGTCYKAEKDMKVAVLDIGYADGISKKRTGSNVSINGKLYKIIGDIGMGMTLVSVDSSVKVHDKVILIGEDVSIRYVANWLNTSSYEVMCMIDSNIERRYIK